MRNGRRNLVLQTEEKKTLGRQM